MSCPHLALEQGTHVLAVIASKTKQSQFLEEEIATLVATATSSQRQFLYFVMLNLPMAS